MKEEHREGGVPFLRCKNVRVNRYEPIGLTFISEEFHRSIRISTLRPGDVVVTRSGNVGVNCVIPDSLPEANCSVEESIAKVQCMVHQGVWRIFWQRASGRWFRYQPCPEAPSLCGSPARDRRRCQRLLLWLNFPHVTLAEQVCVRYPGQEVAR